MPRHDWLVGRDRRSEAAERIYAAAADLIARRGYEAFTIEALAAQVHCSPATIYRHAGGKAAIRDAVVATQATRIVDSAREFAAIPESAVQPPPETMAGTSGRYLRGVADVDGRIILILDVAGVLDSAAT